MRRRFVFAVLMLLIGSLVRVGLAHTAADTLFLTLPHLEWAMKIKAPGFGLDRRRTNPGGESAYFMASNKETGLIISGHIDKVGKPGTPKEAREHFWATLMKAPVKRGEVTLSEFGNMATTEYMVREFQGRLVNQKNLYAFLTKDHYWMYAHFSKTNYHQAEEALFKSMPGNISIGPKNPSGKIETTYRLSNAPHYLTLNVPETWTDEIKRARGNLSPTFIFRPGALPASEVHVTPMWSPQQEPGFNSPEKVRKIVRDSGDASLPRASEKELILKEMKGKSAYGLYYTLTDKKPDLPHGEFKYITQGGMGVGSLLIMFTIFTNEKDSPLVSEALRMMTDARDAR